MNDVTLAAAAERWGTPLYVTDVDAAVRNAVVWRDALPGALVAYAVKANSDPVLLERLAEAGFGFEVVGPVELELARRAGADPSKVVVNGIGQTDADLAAALEAGALVNAESLGGLDALLRAARRGERARIGLRVNPGFDVVTHDHLATGRPSSKFGIALDELDSAVDRFRAADALPASVGAHIGSAIRDADAYRRLARLLVEVARRIGAGKVNLGGGFIGSPPEHAAAVRPVIEDLGRVIVEPGRSVVANAGWLLTRVVRVQARGHVVVDAGMTELLRPMLYGARHPVTVVAPGEDVGRREGGWTVSGPICEAGDVLVEGIDLGDGAGEGALLAIGEAGAYGVVMASNYNGRLRPAQVVVDRGELRLSRRRETLDDLVARDVGR